MPGACVGLYAAGDCGDGHDSDAEDVSVCGEDGEFVELDPQVGQESQLGLISDPAHNYIKPS